MVHEQVRDSIYMCHTYIKMARSSQQQIWQDAQLQTAQDLRAYLHIHKERGKLTSLVECLRCTNMHAMPYSIPFKILFSFLSEIVIYMHLASPISFSFNFPLPSFIFKIQLGLGVEHTHTHTTHTPTRKTQVR